MVSYGINNGGTISGDVTVNGSSATDQVLSVQVAGDAAPGCVIRADGRIELGGRVTPPDVALFRDGSTRLHTINTFLTEGDVQADVAGRGLIVREGSNARMGTATLVAGSAVVANTSVTANTRILLTSQADGGTPGWLRVSARTAGTSFTITSSSASDTSTVAYFLLEPAA
jgi:hypothetical protein